MKQLVLFLAMSLAGHAALGEITESDPAAEILATLKADAKAIPTMRNGKGISPFGDHSLYRDARNEVIEAVNNWDKLHKAGGSVTEGDLASISDEVNRLKALTGQRKEFYAIWPKDSEVTQKIRDVLMDAQGTNRAVKAQLEAHEKYQRAKDTAAQANLKHGETRSEEAKKQEFDAAKKAALTKADQCHQTAVRNGREADDTLKRTKSDVELLERQVGTLGTGGPDSQIQQLNQEGVEAEKTVANLLSEHEQSAAAIESAVRSFRETKCVPGAVSTSTSDFGDCEAAVKALVDLEKNLGTSMVKIQSRIEELKKPGSTPEMSDDQVKIAVRKKMGLGDNDIVLPQAIENYRRSQADRGWEGRSENAKTGRDLMRDLADVQYAITEAAELRGKLAQKIHRANKATEQDVKNRDKAVSQAQRRKDEIEARLNNLTLRSASMRAQEAKLADIRNATAEQVAKAKKALADAKAGISPLEKRSQEAGRLRLDCVHFRNEILTARDLGRFREIEEKIAAKMNPASEGRVADKVADRPSESSN